MNNPWLNINLDDYEGHMAFESVMQLQALNAMMASQFADYPAETVMVLGVAGGNGLEHVNRETLQTLFGVDINGDYLAACKARHPELDDVFAALEMDVANDSRRLPKADLVIADLFIEYIGTDAFCQAIDYVDPSVVSCILQSHEKDCGIASASPYMRAFDNLDSIVKDVGEGGLVSSMAEMGYRRTKREDNCLPNGKVLTRLDFVRS